MAANPLFVKDVLETYLSGTTLYAMLVLDAYVPLVTDEFVSDISAYEVAAAGYSRQVLTSVSVVHNTLTGEIYIRCADPNFGTFTQVDVLGPVFYIDGASDADSRIISAAIENPPTDIVNTVATIFRIDPDQGFFLGQT